MKVWRGLTPGLIFALLVAWPITSIEAASLSGRSSTALEWYETAEEEAATPAYQYLQLNAKDLLKSGYNFKFYGRLADDLSNEVNVDSRLYYAYLEKALVIYLLLDTFLFVYEENRYSQYSNHYYYS